MNLFILHIVVAVLAIIPLCYALIIVVTRYNHSTHKTFTRMLILTLIMFIILVALNLGVTLLALLDSQEAHTLAPFRSILVTGVIGLIGWLLAYYLNCPDC